MARSRASDTGVVAADEWHRVRGAREDIVLPPLASIRAARAFAATHAALLSSIATVGPTQADCETDTLALAAATPVRCSWARFDMCSRALSAVRAQGLAERDRSALAIVAARGAAMQVCAVIVMRLAIQCMLGRAAGHHRCCLLRHYNGRKGARRGCLVDATAVMIAVPQ